MTTENMKQVVTPIDSLYDVEFDTLLELKNVVNRVYEEIGDVEIVGDIAVHSITYREKTHEEIEEEYNSKVKYEAAVRKNWERTAKAYGWKYE